MFQKKKYNLFIMLKLIHKNWNYLKQLDRINGICDELNDANNAIGAISEEIGSTYAYENTIEAWKDIVLAALPGNCSAAFAADVEEALSKFTSVY